MANRTRMAAALALMAGLVAAGCGPVAGDQAEFGFDRQGAPNMNQSQTGGKGAIPDQGAGMSAE